MKLGSREQEAPETEREVEQDMPVLNKKASLGGTEYAKKMRDDSERLKRNEQTGLFAYLISELSVHTESPEMQLNDVMQTMSESGAFDEFKPKDWNQFFKVFIKKFEGVTDKITRLDQAESLYKSQLAAVESEKNDHD